MVTFPTNEGSAYYLGVARNLLEGHGLVSDALWSYAMDFNTFGTMAFHEVKW